MFTGLHKKFPKLITQEHLNKINSAQDFADFLGSEQNNAAKHIEEAGT